MAPTRLLDPAHRPVLGPIHAVNRKHRLRSKHYEAVGDWPEHGATVEVVPGTSLDGIDHFPCTDEVLIVSDRLLEVLRSVAPELESFTLDAGGRTVHLVLPISEGDVMYEADGDTRYSQSGYNVTDAHDLRVSDAPEAAFCSVRNTRLLALSDELVTAAEAAGVVWTLHDAIERYPLARSHPYRILDTNHAAIAIGGLEARSAWPELPAGVGHPLGGTARDASLERDPDEAWLELCADVESIDEAAKARYCSGLALPELGAHLDERCAKSKLKKRWKDTLTVGFSKLKGLPCVSASLRDSLLAAGVEATFVPVTLVDRALDQHTELYRIEPSVVVDWIEWPRSDVGLRWSGMLDEYFGLYPSEASYLATTPLVRVRGSNLILIHESLAPSLVGVVGLRMIPLGDQRAARNLDDYVRVS